MVVDKCNIWAKLKLPLSVDTTHVLDYLVEINRPLISHCLRLDESEKLRVKGLDLWARGHHNSLVHLEIFEFLGSTRIRGWRTFTDVAVIFNFLPLVQKSLGKRRTRTHEPWQFISFSPSEEAAQWTRVFSIKLSSPDDIGTDPCLSPCKPSAMCQWSQEQLNGSLSLEQATWDM